MTISRAVDWLEEYAFWLEVGGGNPFKVKAWVKAVEALDSPDWADLDLERWLADPARAALSGIGKSARAALEEMAQTGQWAALEGQRAAWPESLLELRRVRGLGPKRIAELHAAGISSRAALRAALDSGAAAAVKGIGPAAAEKLAQVLVVMEAGAGRVLLETGLVWEAQTRPILLNLPGVGRVEALGELRGNRETLEAPELLVETRDAAGLRRLLEDLGAMDPDSVAPTTSTAADEPPGQPLQLRDADGSPTLRLRPCLPEDWTRVLVEHSGSGEFLDQLRAHAAQAGVDWVETATSARTEEEFFAALGLDWIDPALREGLGEVQAAAAGKLPRLVRREELRGTFHNHTTASDGAHSLAQMAQAARDLGLDYLGIADHSKGAFQANGLDENRLRAQIREIAELNAEFAAAGERFRLLAGSEVEVKKDGSLDFDDDLLAELDFVVASLHVPYSLDEAGQTARAITAVSHPLVTMLAHPSGRLLLHRPPLAMDLVAVAEAAADQNTIVEINCSPHRLDLDWRIWRQLGDRAPLTSINPDAHSMQRLLHLDLGVRIARKAGLRADQVLNTRELDEVQAWLKLAKSDRSR